LAVLAYFGDFWVSFLAFILTFGAKNVEKNAFFAFFFTLLCVKILFYEFRSVFGVFFYKFSSKNGPEHKKKKKKKRWSKKKKGRSKKKSKSKIPFLKIKKKKISPWNRIFKN
jgi:NADH:ubiquinone oxidoreductase subunit 5 (subunit L)/multisubunit Na+/H+ antiporter MnhA subunit